MNTEELNALKEKAYKWAVEHGFHEEEKPDAFYLGLVMSEMGEAINADRKGMHANPEAFMKDWGKVPFKDSFEAHIKDSVEDEIADIVIRLLDFAGLRGYKLDIGSIDHAFSNYAIQSFDYYKLPGILISINALLTDALTEGELPQYVGTIICVLSDCFERMTGSDKDLWWFVEQKMRYNELRPMLNGKKY